MQILMDKGLNQQDIWPDKALLEASLHPDETHDLKGLQAFWGQNYPAKDFVIYSEPDENKGNTDFWPALCVNSHTHLSQYDMLREHWLPQADKLGPMAWLALTGDGFHGQRQRSWLALPGNMHLSLGIEPHLPAAEYSHALTMLPVVCLLDILQPYDCFQDEIGIKWVNDVLIGQRKLAGVLTSARTEKGIITGAVLGIGLNITSAPRLPASSFVQGSTCLHEYLGQDTPSLGGLVTSLLKAVGGRLLQLKTQGALPLYLAYKDYSLILGQRVAIWPEEAQGQVELQPGTGPLRQGIVQTINPDLGLVLEGQSEPVVSGRLVWHSAVDDNDREL